MGRADSAQEPRPPARALDDAESRLVLGSSVDVVLLYGADGRLRWASPSLETVFGYDPELVVGTPFRLGGDDPVLAAELEAEVMAQAASDSDVAAVRGPVRCADGGLRWCESRVRMVHRTDGSVEHVVVSVRDVHEQVEAEIALAASERRFRLLAEGASDVVFETDLDGVIAWMSPAVRAVLGYEPDDLVGTRVFDLVHPAYAEAVDRSRHDVDAGKAARGVEFEVVSADGTPRWVSAVARPLPPVDGVPQGAVVGWRDIDELVRARDEAAREAALLHTHTDAVLDSLVLVESVRDQGGRIVDFRYREVNEATCRYLGLPRDQLIGSTFLERLPGMAGSGLIDVYAAVVETGEPLALDDQPYANEVLGEVRRYDIRANRVGDGLSLMWHDSTERYAAQRRLAESEERFRLLADNATDVIIQTGPDRRIEWVSPSVTDVLGWPVDAVLGRPMGDLVHPDDLARLRAEFRAVLESGVSSGGRYEGRFATADGGWRWVSGSGRVVRDGAGNVTGSVDALRDIEAEHAAREALEESQLRYRLMAENASDVVFRMDPVGVITWTSGGSEPIHGWRPEQVTGLLATDLIDPRDLEWALRTFGDVEDGVPRAVRLRLRTAEGGSRWIESRIKPVRGEDEQVVELIGGWRDIDAEVQAQLELERRARTDDLTGLLNRGAGLDRLGELLADQRRSARAFAVAFCDIDRFKDVNDTYGHAAGDHLLRVVAERVLAVVRAEDLVIRMGGDEFLVLLDGVDEIGAATSVAEKIRRVMNVPVPYEDEHLHATMSIGVTVVHEDDTLDALVARADKAMYLGKQAGRDQVVPFE